MYIYIYLFSTNSRVLDMFLIFLASILQDRVLSLYYLFLKCFYRASSISDGASQNKLTKQLFLLHVILHRCGMFQNIDLNNVV